MMFDLIQTNNNIKERYKMIDTNFTTATRPEQETAASLKSTNSKAENIKMYIKGDYMDIKQYTHKTAVHIS